MKKIILVFFSCLAISFQSQAQIEVALNPISYTSSINNISVSANITNRISLEYNRRDLFGKTRRDGYYNKQNQIALKYFWKSNNGNGFFSSVYYGQKDLYENFYVEKDEWSTRGGGGFNVISGVPYKTGDLLYANYDRRIRKTHIGIENGYRLSFSKNFFFDISLALQDGKIVEDLVDNLQGDDISPGMYIESPIKFNLKFGARFGVVEKQQFNFF
ncbi:MAG: hypothetical protein AB8G11_17255 [Saprospiraceae bacterium]